MECSSLAAKAMPGPRCLHGARWERLPAIRPPERDERVGSGLRVYVLLLLLLLLLLLFRVLEWVEDLAPGFEASRIATGSARWGS